MKLDEENGIALTPVQVAAAHALGMTLEAYGHHQAAAILGVAQETCEVCGVAGARPAEARSSDGHWVTILACEDCQGPVEATFPGHHKGSIPSTLADWAGGAGTPSAPKSAFHVA